ncbi:hypothetical protein JHK87_004905 [Glycine soja]|nr:hypothetical protein JHK87_004905 [Glycine soja]
MVKEPRQHPPGLITRKPVNEAVYTSTSYVFRKDLREHLPNLQDSLKGPWSYIGDFNVVLCSHGKRRGCLPSQRSCNDFRLLDNSNSPPANQYHTNKNQGVELYTDYDPKMLLPFLRSSQHYTLEKAYEICIKRDLLREQVFILGRIGNSKQALAVIINKLGDVEEAVEFVTMQHDDELWEELIKQCLHKPKMV